MDPGRREAQESAPPPPPDMPRPVISPGAFLRWVVLPLLVVGAVAWRLLLGIGATVQEDGTCDDCVSAGDLTAAEIAIGASLALWVLVLVLHYRRARPRGGRD